MEPLFYLLQDRFSDFVDVALVQVLDRDRVHDHFLLRIDLRTFLGSRSRDESDSIEHRMQMIVGAGNGAFREYDEWSLCRNERTDRAIDGLPIDAFAVNAESAHLANCPGGKSRLMKQVPAGHRVEMTLGLACKPAKDNGIGVAAMIGSQHDAHFCVQRVSQPVGVANLEVNDPFGSLEPNSVKVEPLNQTGPKSPFVWRDELVRFFNDDFVHRGDRLALVGNRETPRYRAEMRILSLSSPYSVFQVREKTTPNSPTYRVKGHCNLNHEWRNRLSRMGYSPDAKPLGWLLCQRQAVSTIASIELYCGRHSNTF